MALLGALNSLAQLVLKATIPGVPDFYQGTEFWDLSLVDPDNRRAVDFAARSAALASLAESGDWEALAAAWPDGRIKLALTKCLLRLRRDMSGLFTDGSYQSLAVNGPDRRHVLAFARSDGLETVVVVVGRQFRDVTSGGRHWPRPAAWDAHLRLEEFDSLADALLPGRVLPGGEISVATLFASLPVAVLTTARR